jgi:hypothetical protein
VVAPSWRAPSPSPWTAPSRRSSKHRALGSLGRLSGSTRHISLGGWTPSFRVIRSSPSMSWTSQARSWIWTPSPYFSCNYRGGITEGRLILMVWTQSGTRVWCKDMTIRLRFQTLS